MSPPVVAKLAAEDLARLRALVVRENGYRVHPAVYSREEIEQNEMAQFRLNGEFVERYGIDDTRTWKVSVATGVIIYGEWGD